MTHTERIDEPFQHNLAARADGIEQVSHGELAETLVLLQFDTGVAFFEREYVGRLGNPALLEEQRNLLLAQSFDVECAAGDEMLQVLDFLEWTGKFAGAARAGALLSSGNRLAHHLRLERTRTGSRHAIRF